MGTLFDSVAANLLTEFIVVVLGVLFANLIQRRIKQWRYGRWRLLIHPGPPLQEGEPKQVQSIPTDKPILDRPLSADTAQKILYDRTEFDIYVKGRISPFADVRCDLVTELDSGNSPIIQMDKANRRIIVFARSPKIDLRTPGDPPRR